jgi:hypothetical protein
MGIVKKMQPNKTYYSQSITTEGMPPGVQLANAEAIARLKKAMDDYQDKHPRASAREVRKWAAKKSGVQVIAKSDTIQKTKKPF